MPSVAQQDYFIIKADNPERIKSAATQMDASLCAGLLLAVKKGTIYDSLVPFKGTVNGGGFAAGLARINFYAKHEGVSNGGFVFIVGNSNFELVSSSEELFRALAIIQKAQDEIKGSPMTALPTFARTLSSGVSYIKASNSGATAVISTEDGFAYAVTIDSGKIATIYKSEKTAEDAKLTLSTDNIIIISEDMAKELIGYAIS